MHHRIFLYFFQIYYNIRFFINWNLNRVDNLYSLQLLLVMFQFFLNWKLTDTLVEGIMKKTKWNKSRIKINIFRLCFKMSEMRRKIFFNYDFVYKEKQRGCPLLGANRYTHIYQLYMCIYIIYLFDKYNIYTYSI